MSSNQGRIQPVEVQSDIVVARLDRVWKQYRLQSSQPATLRERLLSLVRRGSKTGPFWALRDVSLEVRAGEMLGIVGSNGSGKTTVLKLLAGITAASRGGVKVVGRCGALIELGAGFHPELSGRENIALSGAILGLSRAEVADRYAGIVEFAELQQFIDTPVKHYSSGMAMRLGFAISVSVDADLLLVDEALSVGDQSFQEKCLVRIGEMRREARSFVIVSHNLGLLESVCTRLLWIDKGSLRAEGKPGDVVALYRSDLSQPSAHPALG